MEYEESSQLNKVVIITLPPAHDPSFGKTISIFSYTEPQSSQVQEIPHQEVPNIPIQPPFNHQNQIFLRRFLLGSSKSALSLVGVFLIAVILCFSAYPQSVFRENGIGDHRLRDENDDGKPSSFVFDLYPKLGLPDKLRNDVELKLGRFVEVNSDNVVSLVDDGVRASKIKAAVSAVESTAILPVEGGFYPDGLYYTIIYVGSPARPYYLDIDTGSDLAWVQCDAPCTSCAKGPHALYKPKKANIIPSEDSLCTEVQKTLKSGYCEACKQCDYEIGYADHSSSMGVLARDYIHLMAANGSVVNMKVAFGCAYDQQGVVLNSLTKTDGILGLSRAKVSLSSQLAGQKIINNVVGHCLTADAAGGGYMFLGDDFVPQRQLEWVSMLNIPTTNSYVAEVSKISYGNNKLSLNGLDNGHVIFDSGSSFTYFTKQAYADLVTTLQSVSTDDLIRDESDTTLPICWRAKIPIRSVSEVKRYFKPITFQFGRKWLISFLKMRIPPEGYLVVNNKGNICLGILDGSDVNDGATIVLGDVSLRGQLVVYDNVNNLIGWMQSDCLKPGTSTTMPFL
ncbi:aspartyl protease APCB1 [Apium graveolens]|uniref:aspartyl protease APCB1 n=1 Tax=Apium graveolens TaxID=4045 RepID=UPI003D79325E